MSSHPRTPTEPSIWVLKQCRFCKRGWRELIDEYGSEEQQRWAYKSRQNNLDQAVRDILLEHPCEERDAWDKAMDDRAKERAKERAAEQAEEEEEEVTQEEQAKKDGKRRSARLKKNVSEQGDRS